MEVGKIFNYIQSLNAQDNYSSSYGSYKSGTEVADGIFFEVRDAVSKGSLAEKILNSNTYHFSEKQLWVIAFDLAKNEEFVKTVKGFNDALNQELEWERSRKQAKRKARKERKVLATA